MHADPLDGSASAEHEERVVVETRPPRPLHRALAMAALVMTLVSSLWIYVEYARQGRASILALGSATLLLSLAFLVLLGFRSSFVFRTEQGIRPYAPPKPEAAPRITRSLGFDEVTGARRWFVALLGTGLGSLGAVLLLPLRSLGTTPNGISGQGRWRAGTRLLTTDGKRVLAREIPEGSTVTVVPEGDQDDYPSIVTVVRLNGSAKERPETGLRAYSRICTHAGCSVSIFNRADNTLVCPCHWSVFDATNGSVVSGPASRGLAHLPIGLGTHGDLVATGSLVGQIGPLLGATCPGSGRRRSARNERTNEG